MNDILKSLEATIDKRRGADPESSYVASLNAKGRSHIARKLGEEAVETVIAAVEGNKAQTASEAADMIFHLLVLLADMDLSINDVLAELERREGLSGIEEKAGRNNEMKETVHGD